MKTFCCLSTFLSFSWPVCFSPDILRTNGEAPEEGGADMDCDGSPLPKDSSEVRAAPAPEGLGFCSNPEDK